MPRIKKAEKPTTSAQSLGSLITSCRKIMRKDKGLSTDLDRLPMLTWILFLKFLDDLEQVREAEAAMEGKRYRTTIAEPYRWRDWAAKPDGMTGDALVAFISQQDDASLPNGKKGPGLFAYLRSLTGSNGGDRRDVIRAVFQGTVNRMLNGYLLRDMLNKVNGIHFTSTDEIYTLGHLYESMLKEMRDAAGENGEFYTPRALVKFIVTVTDPRIGETVLDPAAGTGGFLAGAFEHLKPQCKTAEQYRRLQRETLYGIEAKPLPYLLCQMNLLLHGVETPNIDPLNALRFPLREIGDNDRVNVILTNPPFGGAEEPGILGNFPKDKQTSETTVLFMQLIMRKLSRAPAGRAAVVVSDGFLSTKGIAARVKQELLAEFNLHTVVRLPRGLFVPYTPIATNVLFFERSLPTKEVWFYEVPGPSDRQTYSKTKPFKFEELSGCMAWWSKRTENTFAWRVSAAAIAERGFDLDITNPSRPPELAGRPPCELLQLVCDSTQQAQKRASDLRTLFTPETFRALESAPVRRLSSFLKLRKETITIDDTKEYELLTVQLHARGIRMRGAKQGFEIKTKKQQVVRAGDLVVAEIDAKMGGYGVVPEDCSGAIVSSHYFIYEIDQSIVAPAFFEWWLRSGIPEILIQPHVKGATNYAAIRQNHFPLLEMRLPESVKEQATLAKEFTTLQDAAEGLSRLQTETVEELNALVPSVLGSAFKITA